MNFILKLFRTVLFFFQWRANYLMLSCVVSTISNVVFKFPVSNPKPQKFYEIAKKHLHS